MTDEASWVGRSVGRSVGRARAWVRPGRCGFFFDAAAASAKETAREGHAQSARFAELPSLILHSRRYVCFVRGEPEEEFVVDLDLVDK